MSEAVWRETTVIEVAEIGYEHFIVFLIQM